MTRMPWRRRLLAVRSNEQRGDTLIEVLIAIVIISLSAVAVLGTLTESIMSSAEHRSFATLDSVLKNFAEAAKYDVQLQPVSSSIYKDCAGQLTPSIPVYRVVSTYPTTAVVGTRVTVFGTSFTPGATASVTLNSVAVPPANFVSGSRTVRSDGTVSASFTLPATATGAQAVVLTDGTNSAPSATALTGTASAGSSGGSPVVGYEVAVASIGWWNSSTKAFDNSLTAGTCSANDKSGIQMINLVATAPSHVSDSLSVVVVNPAFSPPNPAPSVSVVASPATPSAGQQITFSANFTGSTGGSSPSGTVAWTFTNSPGNPICANSALTSTGVNTSTATCIVPSALPGIYQLAANYSGDGNYSPTAGYSSVTVPKSTPTVGVNIAPSSPILGNALTFSATVTGSGNITPTGTVSWVFTASPAGTSPSCTPSTLGGSGNTAATTSATNCVVPNAQVGTYSVTATYQGDTVYLSGNGTGSTTVRPTPITITSVVTANGSGGTAGKLDPNDTITITFSGQINAHTVCSAWTNGLTSVQSASTGSVITVSNTGSGDNILSATGPTTGCGTFNFGTLDLGTAQYVTGNSHKSVTFTNSTFAYNGTTHTLTITFGTKGGSGALGTVPSSALTLTLSNNILDSGSNPLGGYTFTSPSGPQF